MRLSDSISAVPNIGPKYKKLLEKLEIKTVEDLLYHFPFRYSDFSLIKKIKDLKEGDAATVKAQILKSENIYTKRRKKITKALLHDLSGEIEAIWYNQHYLKKLLKEGSTFNFSGKVGIFSNKLSFIGPEFEEEAKKVNTGRLVPIYPETAGVSSKWIRARINEALKLSSDLDEFIPQELLNKYDLPGFEDALHNFHFPNSAADTKKARERFAFEEFLLELLKVEGRKKTWQKDLKSHQFNIDSHNDKIEKLIKSLPFKLSDTQKKALKDISNDLSREHPMNRLLEGDVGTGKTILAVISSYITFLNGFKGLYMAPTEILANQHYETFKEILEGFGVKIGLSTGSSRINNKDEFDILIGTHALLYNQKDYDNTGLVVIDEQHRFGVEQRAKLISMSEGKTTPHLLTMTATPIPRTLALTLYGDLAVSILEMPETIKKDVKTWIIFERKRDDAYKWIAKQNESVFIVCPLIEESEHESMENIKAAEAEYQNLINGYFSGLKVGLLHGRMKPKEKQIAVKKFQNNEIQILVSTPVIEVGVDIPQAAIMVIESAERYGLASLHQLRGRVGRKGGEAYCLVIPSSTSPQVIRRLRNLEKYNDGLKLAEIDLKLRGQGDIYGTYQHGFIRFKVANPYDIKLLEQVKQEAQNIFPNLDKNPLLNKKVMKKIGGLIGSN